MNFNILKACTINVNSISNKINYINNLIAEEKLHIIALSETWLTNNCNSSFVNIPGFSLCRGDVAGTIRKHGAAIYVKNSLKYIQIEVKLPNIAVIKLVDLEIYVMSVYRPPSYLPGENSALMEFISTFVQGKETIVLGDFNLPSLKWSNNSVHSDYINPNDRLFYNCFVECGFSQWVNFPTFFPSENILDLVLSTDDDRIVDLYPIPPLPGCHHCPVIFSIVFSYSLPEVGEEAADRRSWTRANFDAISEYLSTVDWERTMDGMSVQGAYNLLLDAIHTCIDDHVPVSNNPVKGKWMTAPPRALAVSRESQWTKYKDTRSIYGRHSTEAHTELMEYQRINHIYRNYSRYKQASYEQKLVNLIPEAPKLFHGYLRERKKGCPSVGPLKDTTGSLVQSNIGMTELFAKAFSSVYVTSTPANPHPYQRSNLQMEDLDVSYDNVREILLGLSPSSSAGADGIHPSFLHHCADVIALPLSLVIEKSLATGDLPTEWKHSRVAPIFKAGSKSNPLNYRPVSVTSAACKVAERLISNHIMSFLDVNGLLANRQFGFRKGRSTEDQLLLSYSKIAKEVDRGLVVDAVYLDYSKAFDVLSHRILIEKAEAIGFSPQILHWVKSFLDSRIMQVSINGSSSSSQAVSSGVPQGSVLGPLLFIIYVNSLGHDFNCEWYSFADDLKLFVSKSKRVPDSVDPSLQTDLENLHNISASWNLRLNPNKCVLMRFGAGSYNEGDDSGYMLGGAALKLTRTHRDLGVLVDSSLRFHPHVAEIVRKSSGLSNQLLRSTVCRSKNFMITLFISHIRPILDYCSTIWNLGYLGDTRQLESVQRRWTANVSGMEGLSYPDRLRRLNLYSIKGRLLRSDLIKIWKAFWCEIDVGLLGLFERQFHISTRGHRFKLSLPLCHSETLRRFFNARTVLEWNSLPAEVVEAQTISTFKSRLDNHMGHKFFAIVS